MVRWSMVTLVLGLLGLVGPAAALSQRTFVSADGHDTNPCSLAAPCRTLQTAVNAVADGGDVIVLDSAGYGALQIYKSVNVFAPSGVYAGISVAVDDGIFISVGNGKVVLRGLTINGGGTAGRGVYVGTLAEFHMENTVISGFTDAGVESTAGAGAQIFIKDSFIRDTDTGIAIGFGGLASIDNVRLEHNRIGARVDDDSTMTVRNSVASGNQTGFFAFTGHGTQSVMNLQNCMVSNNATGVEERFSAAVLDNLIVTGNTTVGVTGLGGIIYSRQNNTVFDNATNVNATITPLPPV